MIVVVYCVLARHMNTTFWSDGMKWYVLLYACAALVTSRASADGCCIRMQKILELVHGGCFFFGGNFPGRRQTWGRWDGWWRHCREGKGWREWRFGARFFCLLKIGKVFSTLPRIGHAFRWSTDWDPPVCYAIVDPWPWGWNDVGWGFDTFCWSTRAIRKWMARRTWPYLCSWWREEPVQDVR